MVSGIAGAFGRLLIFQASWTYDRLQGVGMAFASLPLLRPLESDPERHRQAVARSTEYFNAHPYLAGIAVGAAARAELDGVPGPTIGRLRTALSGPLGSLGDQLFWIGVVPVVVGALLVAVSQDAGFWAVPVGLGLYVVVRLLVTYWGLQLGLSSGSNVGAALKASGLQAQAQRVGLAAGFVVGVAFPLVVDWVATPIGNSARVAALVGALAGVGAALVRFRVPPARRLTLIAMGIACLVHWSIR